MTYLLIGTVLSFAVVGCASFPGKELPKYTFEQIEPPAKKVSVDYEAIFLMQGQEVAFMVREFEERISKIFAKANFFLKYGLGIGSADYHFKITLNHTEAQPTFMTLVSGITLTLIPWNAKDEFSLSIEVKKGDQLLKEYQYKEHMDTWFQLFMIFLTPTHHPVKVKEQIIDDLLLNFLHDLKEDKILK
jgi:hypothetical protein